MTRFSSMKIQLAMASESHTIELLTIRPRTDPYDGSVLSVSYRYKLFIKLFRSET
jgi:hypothetical protein